MIPPLAIVQARLGSARLPGKVLLPLGGKSLIQHVWERAAEAFYAQHVVVACPADELNKPLRTAVENFGGQVFAWDGPENDVLGRFHACAHTYRWHPDSVIVRVTPDDWNKQPAMMKRVAAGERLPVELGAEAFTLAQLDAAMEKWVVEGFAFGRPIYNPAREHITHALFSHPAPAAPDSQVPWSIDSREDYDAVRRAVEGH